MGSPSPGARSRAINATRSRHASPLEGREDPCGTSPVASPVAGLVSHAPIPLYVSRIINIMGNYDLD